MGLGVITDVQVTGSSDLLDIINYFPVKTCDTKFPREFYLQ